MKTILTLVVIICLIVTMGCIRKKSQKPGLESLIIAERAFSKKSEIIGMRAAFLTYLSDDAIVFQPHPINGKKVHTKSPNIPGMLIWKPIFADISLAGDMGYTTGPWEFRKDGSAGEPRGFGHYVSIWKRQTNGLWRVAIDAGISYETPDTTVTELSLPEKNGSVTAVNVHNINIEAEKSALLEVDRNLSTISSRDGFVKTFLANSTDDVRVYRINAFPVIGKKAGRSLLLKKQGRCTWKPMMSGVAKSGDLGYTYGISEFKSYNAGNDGDESNSYLRIWKKQQDGKWKIVLDISNPIPPAVAKFE